jgi:hypothetical protein
MAWSTPLTAVSNAVLTAAQWNASVRDNLLETATAKATTAGYIFTTTATNAVAQRAVISDTITTSETTTSLTYTDLATNGPQISSVTTGPLALVMYAAQMAHSGSGATCYTSWTVFNASTVAPDDGNSILLTSAAANQAIRCSDTRRLTGLTPGLQGIKLQYRVSTATGTFQRRHLVVIAL